MQYSSLKIKKLVTRTSELKPSIIIMEKKRTDHTGATGITESASGYTMNTSPGPENSGMGKTSPKII